jgi:signal transduction histidine kinase
MKKILRFFEGSIAAKILLMFLGLSVVAMGITGYLAFSYIREMGDYALESSRSVGQSAIQDSTKHLVKLGEETVTQMATTVAKQIQIYLESRPLMTVEEMRNDETLREIAVQPVGLTGYTTILDPNNHIIIIHKFPEQEKDLTPLKDIIPTFWSLLESSLDGKASFGYYDWREVDGSITRKYAYIAPISIQDGQVLTLWATTYIDEFSRPVEDTKREISVAISNSSDYINGKVSQMRDVFLIIFTVLANLVVGLALLLSRLIINPIVALKHGAEAIGIGKLDYTIKVNSKDELGDLARTFNKMGLALKSNMEELKRTAVDNIAKERRIQSNLRLYSQKVSQAQEAERKRIARELHDETIQELIVVMRHIDALATGKSDITASQIQGEVRKILEGVRSFSQELRPSILDDLGLIPAIQWLASDLTKIFGISVVTEVRGAKRHLSQETELMLFRIVQEALTNVRKHSQATSVFVLVEFMDRSIKVSIQDNGKGLVVPSKIEELARTGKLGLTGMQERAELLGGTIKIDSQGGKGTIVSIEIPLDNKTGF